MVSPRLIEKSFETWKGLHKGYSDLSRPPGFAVVCQNAVIDDNYDIIQRKGFKICSGKQFTSSNNYSGIHTYSYKDASGNQVEELITFALNAVTVNGYKMGYCYRSFDCLIQYTGAGIGTLSFLPIAGNLWQLALTEDGVNAAGFPATYASTIDSGASTDLTTVLAAINALPNWVVTSSGLTALSPAAPNTLPVDVFPTTPIQGIDATGTTFKIFAFNGFALWATGCSPVPKNTPLHWNAINWDYLNMSNLLFIAPCGDYLYKYAGGAISHTSSTTRSPVYRAGMPPSEGVYSSSVAAGALTGDYVYHTTNVFYDRQGNRIEGAPSPDFSITLAAQNPTLNILSAQCGPVIATVNGAQANVTTILVNPTIPSDLKISTDPEATPERRRVGFYNRRNGLQFALQWGAYPVTSVDRVANTITIQGNTVDVNNGDLIVYAEDRERFLVQGAIITANQVGVNVLVHNNTAYETVTPFIGDKVYFLNRATGNYEERTVTAFTSGVSITISGAVVNVNAGDFISFGCRIALYRTLAGGTEKYLVNELPNNGFEALTVYTDSVTDATIFKNGKYLEPERIPMPGPKCYHLVSHQGLLVCTDGKKIYFSEPGEPENFPDENSFIIPFSVKGEITGLASEGGVLVVFKKHGRARVYGDLSANAFTSEIIEDGIGCESGHTIQNTPVGLIWLSQTGFQKSVNGVLDAEFNSRLSMDFKGQEFTLNSGDTINFLDDEKLVLKKAVSINDYRNKRYLCYVPALTGTFSSSHVVGGISSNLFEKWYVYDYKTDMWGNFTMPSGCNALAGMALYENELFMATSASWDTVNTANYLLKEANLTSELYNAADNTQAIDWVVEPTWDTGGEPSAFKKWLRLKTWISNPLVASTFTLAIKAYYDFNAVTTNAFTTASRVFTQEVTLSQVVKLKTLMARSLKLQFRNNVLHESPRITGYELEVTIPVEKEIK